MKNIIYLIVMLVLVLVVAFAAFAIRAWWLISAPDYGHTRSGIASWYSSSRTRMECASRCYAKGTMLKVTYGRRFIIVEVTSRGPAWKWFRRGRIIDLAFYAFQALEDPRMGLIRVEVEPWSPIAK